MVQSLCLGDGFGVFGAGHLGLGFGVFEMLSRLHIYVYESYRVSLRVRNVRMNYANSPFLYFHGLS